MKQLWSDRRGRIALMSTMTLRPPTPLENKNDYQMTDGVWRKKSRNERPFDDRQVKWTSWGEALSIWALRAKIMRFIEADIRHWMRSLRMLYSVTLTFIFKVNNFFIVNISEMMWAGGKNEWYDADRVWYLSSNDTAVIVAFHDLDLNFQGKKCKTFVSRKRWELA